MSTTESTEAAQAVKKQVPVLRTRPAPSPGLAMLGALASQGVEYAYMVNKYLAADLNAAAMERSFTDLMASGRAVAESVTRLNEPIDEAVLHTANSMLQAAETVNDLGPRSGFMMPSPYPLNMDDLLPAVFTFQQEVVRLMSDIQAVYGQPA